jgi:hypothetical protein
MGATTPEVSTMPCFLCGKVVDPNGETTWKQVEGWVRGKKQDSMTLRRPTGEYAHEECITNAKNGVLPEQEGLF